MPRWLLIDEFRVQIQVPRGDRKIAQSVQRTLAGSSFRRQLQVELRRLTHQIPGLRGIMLRVTR
jgi:hypothetical protein